MKKLVVFGLFLLTVGFVPQKERAFDVGEWFKFRIHFGIVNAGYATLDMKEDVRNGHKVFHAVGRGYTTGMTKLFFKVEDNYESFFDKETGNPYQYIRQINEGGYKKNEEGFFNDKSNSILVKDYKNNTEKNFVVPDRIQDILSTFYFLRNYPTIDKLKIGESVGIDMFFDGEVTKFKLKYLGNEDLDTKFGIIPCMIFRPYVQAGRVFKEQESLTVWISDDDNKMPISIKASLSVGSLKADLDGFKGLKYPFTVKIP